MTAARHGNDGRSVAMLLTPQGSGAIAVVRLCGPLNSSFAESHLTRAPRLNHCIYCDVRDGGETLDDVVVLLTDAGALDVNVHGGPWVIQAILNVAQRAGYVIEAAADAPDLALDAVDEIERQMLADLPAARSRNVLQLLTAQPAAWRTMLAADDRGAMQRALADIALDRALSLPTVAIVGPPNVGKSTLANALFGQTRSITADVPGTTRDWVGELADIDGLIVRLIDTPGIRRTTDVIEAAAIDRARGVIGEADLVLIVNDGLVSQTENEAMWIDQYRQTQSALFVRTKADLAGRDDALAGAINVSATRGDGLEALRTAIRSGLGCSDLESPHARCWTAGQRERLARLLSLPAAALTIPGSERSRPTS